MLERGKKLYPSKAKNKVVEDGISDDTWRIFHKNNSYIFEYLSGSHGGGTKEHTISKDDFDRVRAGKMTAYDEKGGAKLVHVSGGMVLLRAA